MTNRGQWGVITAVIAMLGAGLFLASTKLGAELFPLKIGSEAPDFSAKPMAPGTPMKGIDNYTGDVVLLNIWATWCGPCRIEMPSMQLLEETLGPKGLKIVAVSVDVAGMEQGINDFADELKLSFEILHDPTQQIEQIYQTTGVPETFIIGRDGRVRRRVIGQDNWSSPANIAFLERLLAEPKPE